MGLSIPRKNAMMEILWMAMGAPLVASKNHTQIVH